MTTRHARRSRLPGFFPLLVLIAAVAVLGVSCGGGGGDKAGEAGGSAKPAARITLGAYTTPREAYGEILPLFQKAWKEKTGQELAFEESYLGSGAQSPPWRVDPQAESPPARVGYQLLGTSSIRRFPAARGSAAQSSRPRVTGMHR